MTTPQTEDRQWEVINARRTESLDAPHILRLVQPSTEQLFGRVNIVDIIEKAVLAVTLNNENYEIMGHAAFFDYPNVKDIDQAQWETWLSKFYYSQSCTALNSLFMHYFVAKEEYAQGCAREILRTVFNAVPDLHYVFLMVPVGIFPDPSIAGIFKPMEKHEDCKGPANKSVVFVCNRHEHVPVLHIRAARVEDNDDLTPIFNRQSNMLQATYGEYFLAELIEAQNNDMKCLIAEVDGRAVGFMSISNDVNLKMLNECFELGSFQGLHKPHQDDETAPPPTPTPTPPPLKDEVDDDKASTKSTGSNKGGETDPASPKPASEEKLTPGTGESLVTKELKETLEIRSRPASASSQKEIKVITKLSDANMGGSAAFLLSDENELPPEPEVESTQEWEQSGNRLSRQSSGSTPRPLQLSLTKRFVPKYFGAPNAFSIQLFCIDDRYEMRSCDFLPMAFSLFPEFDFCILTAPHMVPEFPLLQNFVRVTPRCPSTLPQELYIFHRSGLLKNFVVRPACTSDYENVEKLVQTIQTRENLLADLDQYNNYRRDADGTEVQAFVAECQRQIVGVAIIRREEDIEYIRSHYNIEDFIYYNHHRREDHGHLHHLALNPIFTHLTKHFLKEILRQSHKTCLYYPLYPVYSTKETLRRHSLVCCLHAMVPVRARRQIVYPKERLGINAPSDRVLAEREPYALCHINRKLTLEPKVTINVRIVVVGASDVGLSFLETFAFCPHLRFNNLTLISPHGLPGEMAPDPLRDQMLPSSYCYGQDEYAKVSLRTAVNVIYGHVTGLNRTQKVAIVNGGAQVPYDHLILCMGQQFQVPAPTLADPEAGDMNNTLQNNPDDRLLVTPPKNLYLVNDAYDAAVALYRVQRMMKKHKPIIVYGCNIAAYTCIQSLLALGVKGTQIALVEPPQQEPPFDDLLVEHAIQQALQDAGVAIHMGYYLARWNNATDVPEEITSASFTSNNLPLTLECQAFFAFYKKGVDINAFKAINDSYLVYDGKLVIDSSFHTNDVTIRAAGPLTKFKRRYHADQWTHANFSSKEIGIALATEMLRLFDPTLERQLTPPTEELNLIPLYRSPRITGAVLPGGYNYLEVIKPGLDDPPDQELSQGQPIREISTGDSDTGYMKLVINQYQAVEKILCLTKKPLPASNLICLYGVHQRTLNNLLDRYDEGLIKDFYEFFQESWAMAVFHDRFADFRDEIRELLITSPEGEEDTLEEKVRSMVDEEVGLTDAQRQTMLEFYTSSGNRRAVETRLLSFLSYNYYHLPMYAKPGMV